MTVATAAGARLRRPADDDGFTLIEVVVALVLTVIVMTTTAGFFISSLSASRLMQQRQSAAAAAEQAMERARAVSISALLARPTVTEDGSTQPTEYRAANTNYRVTTTVTSCGRTPAGDCDESDVAAPNELMYRVTVTVQWRARGGARCSGDMRSATDASVCEYTVSTLRDPGGASIERLEEVPS